VGQKRSISLGKESGAASIAGKLDELGILLDLSLVPALLSMVKDVSVKENSSVSDSRFIEIAKRFMAFAP
jgi:isopropylmalate/homocitrate/citramalate synthase